MAVLVIILSAGIPASAQPAPQDPPEALPEYVLKAGFLYNLAKYVEWPAEAFEQPNSPITIGIVGADPFGAVLEKVLTAKTAKNRPFQFHRFAGPETIQRCHILFIARSVKDKVPEILLKTQSWPVLTVGETEGFPQAGGAANILIENEKPKLEVNPEAAEKARLTIDAKVLRLARIVRTVKDP